ncbi:PAS domain-containing protein [Tabrizicola sp. J26]|uniref:PAS domain-containing protein n=1 Tax=Alitabrizicola rongguiensis TaxID=2909234 RepID=UPI001F41D83D|nr:PAS domain-containing protein [Tabrizicola rongguiensis]MCF1709889.1 PAS domain-containing protein [Tabrizicola rongguiensis]
MKKDRRMGDFGMGTAFQPLQEVRAYWEGLRSGNAPPARAALDPRGMERSLEHVFLIERVAHGVARFRLAGMHLVQLLGMEVRGMPLTALFEPAARDRVMEATEAVFATPSILTFALAGDHGLGRPAIEARMLLLPVMGDTGSCDRALGCLVTLGLIGRSPRRFSVTREVPEPLAAVSWPAVPIDRTPSPIRQADPVRELAEAPAPFHAIGKAKTHRSHLRLVKSDD